jgi:hypothetical protein
MLKSMATGQSFSGVPRGDAQDARASPLPPLCIPPPGHVHPPPLHTPAVMRKDEAVGSGHWATRKKCKFVYQRLDNFLPHIIMY